MRHSKQLRRSRSRKAEIARLNELVAANASSLEIGVVWGKTVRIEVPSHKLGGFCLFIEQTGIAAIRFDEDGIEALRDFLNKHFPPKVTK